MEFEVVFFYDLDEALQGDDKELMNRYLYVGISRVTGHWQLTSSHLATSRKVGSTCTTGACTPQHRKRQ